MTDPRDFFRGPRMFVEGEPQPSRGSPMATTYYSAEAIVQRFFSGPVAPAAAPSRYQAFRSAALARRRSSGRVASLRPLGGEHPRLVGPSLVTYMLPDGTVASVRSAQRLPRA